MAMKMEQRDKEEKGPIQKVKIKAMLQDLVNLEAYKLFVDVIGDASICFQGMPSYLFIEEAIKSHIGWPKYNPSL